jgi:2-isopropylmalate synthase
MQHISIYDTTLRDGTQSESISFSVEDKLKIVQHLDDFGADYIEGGWPGSNPRDIEFFRRARSLQLKHAKLSAFSSTRRAKNTAQDDPNLRALIETETPVVTIFGKTWRLHVHEGLQISDQENLDLIEDSVAFLVGQGREVVYDAEHFFDGYKESPEYALQTLHAARRAGASMLVLCDTNGGTMTREIALIVRDICGEFPKCVGIHTHNDSELAVANSLAAVDSGAVQVQGTVNGYGERCGNANLCSIIPNLQLKMGYDCVPPDQVAHLMDLSSFVADLANLQQPKYLPFVGQSAFAHKAGVHVNAVMKDPVMYEHLDPKSVGNHRRVLVSDLSGRSNIMYKAKELGITLDEKSEETQRIVESIKEKEFYGYHYENADGSLELLMKEQMSGWREFFELGGFKVIIHKDSDDAETISEAIIKVKVGDQIEYTASDGNGPVNALDSALRKALEKFYPQVKDMVLGDYKVRVLDGQDGTGARVRVLITTRNSHSSWNTVGVSPNLIEASWKALVDSVYYYLTKISPQEQTKKVETL